MLRLQDRYVYGLGWRCRVFGTYSQAASGDSLSLGFVISGAGLGVLCKWRNTVLGFGFAVHGLLRLLLFVCQGFRFNEQALCLGRKWVGSGCRI